MTQRCAACFYKYDVKQESVCPVCGHKENTNPENRESDGLYLGYHLQGKYELGMICSRNDTVIQYKALCDEKIYLIREYFPKGQVYRLEGTAEVLLREYNEEENYKSGLNAFYDYARKLENLTIQGLEEFVDVIGENNTIYVISKWIDGIKLDKYILEEQRLSLDDTEEIVFALAQILQKLHHNGIIFRNLNPECVILGNDKNVYAVNLLEEGILSGSVGKKETSLAIGYASPESYENLSRMGQWSDVYSLGALMYYMLSGINPIKAVDKKGRRKTIREVEKTVPRYIDLALQKAMSEDRSFRFLKVDQFLQVLTERIKVKTPQQESRKYNRKKRMGMLVLLAVIGIGAAASVFLWQVQKGLETLPEVKLTIWYQKTGNAEWDYAKESGYLDVAKKFHRSFPTVTFNLEAIPSEEMGERLLNASVSGSMPDLFESDGQEQILDYIAGPVEGIIKRNNACLFMKQYQSEFEAQKQIPLGFSLPVLYANESLTNYNSASVNHLTELSLIEGADIEVLACDPELENALETAFKDAANVEIIDDLYAFYNKKAGYLFADVRRYPEIRAVLPGYEIKNINAETVLCTPGALWSMSKDMTEEEQKAARRFLQYCCSDSAQDILFLQYESEWLPINKNALLTYSDVYLEMKPVIDSVLQNSDQYIMFQ